MVWNANTTKLAGKVALITGGTSGIGAALVRLFAAEGAKVAFCGRRLGPGKAPQNRAKEGQHDVMFVQADVSRPLQVDALVKSVIGRYGRLDIVVNNAGINLASPIESMPLKAWRELLNVNITGMFLVIRATIPHLRAAGGGCIINVGSTYGLAGAAGAAAYALTKGAAINLARSLAVELAPYRIRVNALCPGGTETPMADKWFAAMDSPTEAKAAELQHYPLRRFAEPSEQAQAALFLASNEASYITGHALIVDGGYLARTHTIG